MKPIKLDSKRIHVGQIESEILSMWKDGDAVYNTNIIHNVFQKYLFHDKHDDPGLSCLWCMMCRMFDDAHGNVKWEERINELQKGDHRED